MNEKSYTAMDAMVDIIAAPSKALVEVKSRKRWFWMPLAIIVLLPVAVTVFYFTWVDFDWLVEETIRIAIRDAANVDVAMAMEANIRGFMSPTTQIVTTAIFIPLVTFMVFSIQAGYLHLVNKVTAGDQALGYGDWFSFSVWTAFVGIFASLGMLVVILMADSNQIGQDQLNPMSFQSLFIHAEVGSSWFNWGNALNLTNIWMLVLMTIGLTKWTGASTGKAAAIACVPWVAIFGIWALMIS